MGERKNSKGRERMNIKVGAEHGIICRLPGERFGYFGWPSVARMDDGMLVAASSGLRTEHICPFGKTVLHSSKDDGRTWSSSRVLNDTPLDDRDAGIVNLGGKAMLVSWFTYFHRSRSHLKPEELAAWEKVMGTWTDDLVQQWLASWIRLTEDGQTWSEPILVPVSTPHGPIRLANGDLLYLGKTRQRGVHPSDQHRGETMSCRSTDGGKTWRELGCVPICEGTRHENYHEPHVVELEDGKLVGMIRFQYSGEDDPAKDQIDFSLFQTESEDGGVTWTKARPTGVYGSPPHLFRHSSGVLICVYGYRKPPFGQRAMISSDNGTTWQQDLVLRDDGPDWDLGYPASVEMPDKSLFTIYYQKFHAGEKCSLLWTRWKLP